jgi:translation initiation factor IF-3
LPNYQVNRSIRVNSALVINGENNLGNIPISDGIRIAQENGLDLVLVKEDPPVCRIMDYQKFLYAQKKAERERNKPKHSDVVKEYKFGKNIGEHDLQVKIRKIVETLNTGYRVKISLMLRNREMKYKADGIEIVKRIYKNVTGNDVQIDNLKVSGNIISAMIAPVKTKA